ncbi:transglutaminaseTgpA domain-containing protein [Streptomyces sp. URMC 126]|uniref:transglutaminase family protein n=1 Tax=Streptomyces sp. URMC 126 TaxID=3423401 RepID=UPI003F1CC3E3
MSGGIRAAACAVAATVGAACAMVPLVDGAGWLVQAAALLAVQAGAGVAVRRWAPPRPVAVAAQALAGLLLLTLVFVRDHAVAGLLPGPSAFREFSRLLHQGAEDVGRYAVPAPETPGIRLMLVGGVLVIGLIVDAVAVTYRSAATAGLPLLALYSVGAGLVQGGRDWLWFLAGAAGYLLLLLAESRERLLRRGPGGPAAGAAGPAPAGPLAPGRAGRRIGVLALGVAVAVPAVLPAIGGGLAPHGRSSGQEREGGTISAVNPLVSLRDSLNQRENRELLRYRTSAESGQDLYLRIVALDRFDGATWRTSERRVTDVPDRLPSPQGLSPDVRTVRVNTSIVAADGYGQDYLPLPYPADWVRVSGQWRYEPEGRTLVGDHGQTTRGLRYQVSNLVVQPTAEQLANAPRPPESLRREYTKVPSTLPAVVAERARQVTEGARSDYERAVRLQEWFAVAGGFTYDTDVRTGGDDEAVARFLEEKRGFCVHFSFSMAAMARTLGIPARVAVGFTAGDPQGDGSMSVGSKDAHAWPELYFEGAGWTRFEPTPSRGSRPVYTVEQPAPGASPSAPVPAPDHSAAPRPAPTAGADCPGRPSGAACPDRSGTGFSAAADDGPGADSGVPVVPLVAAGALLVALLAAPPLWRTRLRARRLGGPEPGTPDEVVRRTLAAWRELLDTAWDYGIPPDATRTPRGAVERIVRDGSLEGDAAAAASRVGDAVELALYAPRPAAGVPVDDVAAVRAGLRAGAGGAARLRAVFAPASLAGALRKRRLRR